MRSNQDQRRFHAWVKFHSTNPHVFEILLKFAREARATHHRLGIKTLVERFRWYTTYEMRGSTYKINHNHAAYYSRLIMAEFPNEFDGFFRTRDTPTFDATVEEIVAAHRMNPERN